MRPAREKAEVKVGGRRPGAANGSGGGVRPADTLAEPHVEPERDSRQVAPATVSHNVTDDRVAELATDD